MAALPSETVSKENDVKDLFRLDGKVAIVTGAGSGIGAQSARLLAARGVKVAVAGLGADMLAKVAAAIGDVGGEAIAVETDVLDEAAIANLVAKTVAAFGGLHLVHGNAGATDPSALGGDMLIADLDPATWDKAMAVNLRGNALLAKHSIPEMLKAGGGSIVFSGSGKGAQGDVDFPAYGASKAGLASLARYIAAQYGKQGIRANVAGIGLVMTEALDANMPAEAQALMLEHHLTPTLGRAEDVARVVAFLLSDEARFITGATIPVDGGFTSHSPVYADMLRMQSATQAG
jgi:NAD(P)-dependent dehydrogenase (short-subunit alcohol dehydrogenase family)